MSGLIYEDRESGIITTIAGMSQSGKSTLAKQRTRRHARFVAWDERAEYVNQGCELIRTIPELARVLAGREKGRFAYQGRKGDFAAFCELAYLWGQEWPCTVLVDELAGVTHAGKAPPGWHELVTKSKYWGMHVYGISQTPSESDKTVWRNADVKVCLMLDTEMDREYMVRLGFRPDDIPRQKLQYIERRAGQEAVTRKNIRV